MWDMGGTKEESGRLRRPWRIDTRMNIWYLPFHHPGGSEAPLKVGL